MYKVLIPFTDDHDARHVYSRGDNYPREGYEPDEKRIAYLMSKETSFGKLGLGAVIERAGKKAAVDADEPVGTDKHQGDDGEDAAKEPEAPAEEAKAEKPKAAKGKK